MKRINILLQVVNFILAALCVALLISCATMTCPKSSRESIPPDCQVTDRDPNYSYFCEEAQYEGVWGCCQYQCQQVKCEGLDGWYMDCTEGGTVLVNSRCDQQTGRCYQESSG
jgi:hypothetical protein